MSALPRRLLLLLQFNHLTEVGATAIYKFQAKMVKDNTLKRKLQVFGSDENMHKRELCKIITKYGSRSLPLEKITRLLCLVFALLSTIGGQNTIVMTDILLEHRGIQMYRKQKWLLVDLVDNETIEKYNGIIKMEEGHLKWLTEWRINRHTC
ncbi:MAG: ferritin-like domain-containing protein [Candidatus Scalindua sp.]|nr:ferritin-like domain-containing protein [Candidatus Scalindua sp.]